MDSEFESSDDLISTPVASNLWLSCRLANCSRSLLVLRPLFLGASLPSMVCSVGSHLSSVDGQSGNGTSDLTSQLVIIELQSWKEFENWPKDHSREEKTVDKSCRAKSIATIVCS